MSFIKEQWKLIVFVIVVIIILSIIYCCSHSTKPTITQEEVSDTKLIEDIHIDTISSSGSIDNIPRMIDLDTKRTIVPLGNSNSVFRLNDLPNVTLYEAFYKK